VDVVNIHSESITADNVAEKMDSLDALLVAPGFGVRGIEGKITAVRHARETGLPFFGICLGMQMAVIEYARNVLGLKLAHSTEMDPDTPHPVIDLMEEQKKVTDKGGTMRLGSYECVTEPDSLIRRIYGSETIHERHRHRWEFNNAYLEAITKAGMRASGRNPESGLVEVVEIPTHPFFIGVQFHPELKSTVEKPHPVFVQFIRAAKKHAEQKLASKSPNLLREMN
jgi:CTP synthase